jgi:hypothetical protein
MGSGVGKDCRKSWRHCHQAEEFATRLNVVVCLEPEHGKYRAPIRGIMTSEGYTMKLSLLFCLALVACHSEAIAPAVNPSLDGQLERSYQDSLRKIQDRMLWEKSVLEEDLKDKEYRKFAENREKFCRTDVMYDAKGIGHRKSYCQ